MTLDNTKSTLDIHTYNTTNKGKNHRVEIWTQKNQSEPRGGVKYHNVLFEVYMLRLQDIYPFYGLKLPYALYQVVLSNSIDNADCDGLSTGQTNWVQFANKNFCPKFVND